MSTGGGGGGGTVVEAPPPPSPVNTDPGESALSPDLLREEKVQSVKEKAVTGAKSLGLRTVYGLGIRLLSSLALSHLLTKNDYGVFGLAAQISSLGMYFGDAGIGGSLVQKKEEPTQDEYFTAFVCQQGLILVFILALTFGTPLVKQVYKLGDSPDDLKAVAIMVAMAWGLLLLTLRVIPMIRLERHLQFSEIARAEMVDASVRLPITVGLAFLHFGPWALAAGHFTGMAVFLVLVWMISRWIPRGRFDVKAVGSMLRYGVPYQLNALVPALLLIPTSAIITRMLGLGGLGLYGWAVNIAQQLPVMLNSVLTRVAFPAYSRLQDDPIALGQYLGKASRRMGAALFTAVSLFALVCPVAVPLVFGKQWGEAVPLVQWFLLDAVFFALISNMAAAQNATGRPMERTWVSVGIGVLRCLGIYVGIRCFGLYGLAPLGSFLPSFLELLVTAYLIRRHNPAGTKTLYRDLLEPTLGNGIVLGLSLSAGFWLASVVMPPVGSPLVEWVRVILGLAVYLLLSALREFATPFSYLRQEAPGLLALVKRN